MDKLYQKALKDAYRVKYGAETSYIENITQALSAITELVKGIVPSEGDCAK